MSLQTVTEVSGMGCGDSNLVGFSCCKLKKIYALYENFIYTGWGPVLGQAPALAIVNLVAPAVAWGSRGSLSFMTLQH